MVLALIVLNAPISTTINEGVHIERAHAAYRCRDGSTPKRATYNTLRCDNGEAPVDDGALSWTSLEWWTSGAFLIYIAGIILGYAGWILNSSIYYFILTASDLIRKGLGDAIVFGWTTIRDLINLTFVFGLIYIGFMTIMKADTRQLKHAIPKIIMYAILINFSLYFAKVIIDLSNISAVEIYNTMALKANLGAGGVEGVDKGISGYFMDKLGLLHLFKSDTLLNQVNGTSGIAQNIGTQFGFGFAMIVSLLILIAAFVFFAGAILIAIRFIVLVLLLILSPVAFASGFIPGIHTEEWSKKWWSTMMSNAIFAPVYMLLLYLSMQMVNVGMLTGFKPAGATVDATGGLGNFVKGEGGETVGAMLNFILVAGFLVASLIVAKQAGAYGASTTLAWGKSIRQLGQRTVGRAIGGATFGLAGAAGRRTLGRLGTKGADSDRLKDMAARGGLSGIIGRRTLSASRSLEKASFDARRVGGMGKNLGIGEGQTGGYKQTLADVKKRDEEYAKSLGTVKDSDPQVLALKEAQKQRERELSLLKNEKEEAKRNKASAEELTKIDDSIKEKEEEIDKAKKAVDQEKNRRQIGSAVTFAETTDAGYKDLGERIKFNKDTLKARVKDLAKETDPKRAAQHRVAIAGLQEHIENLEKEQSARLTALREENGISTGYAGYIESYSKGFSGAAWSALYGRNRQMNKKSAEGLRDAYKKKDKEKEKKDTPKKEGGEKKEEPKKEEGGHDHH